MLRARKTEPKPVKKKAFHYNVSVRLAREGLPYEDTVVKGEGDTQLEVIDDAVARAKKIDGVTGVTVHGMNAV